MKLIRPIVPDMWHMKRHLAESFESGQLSNFGPALRRFAAALGGPVLASSGHAAIMAAVDAIGARRWAIPAFTFESTRLAVVSQGLEAVLVDVDPATGCIDVAALAARDDFDAVLAVCPLSTIPDFAAIARAARGRPVVADAAATWGSPMALSFVRAWCVSFHATKTFPIGEGGAIFGLDAAAQARAESFLQFGFDSEKRPSGRGINGKLSDYAAAVGLALIEDGLAREIEARRRNAAAYRAFLGDLVPASAAGVATIYSTLPIFAASAAAAAGIRARLAAAGIGFGQYYRPLAPLTGAASCFARNVCLPVHGDLHGYDIGAVCAAVLG